jgi:glycosyltransferase involved in cell wall biosynthesis
MSLDLSIIIPTSRPHTLAHVLGYIEAQSAHGITFEVVLIQEARTFEEFKWFRYGPRYNIIRQSPGNDFGAKGKDTGIINAKGQYVVFWDDDNLYYPHAVASLFATTNGHDMGVCRIRHRGFIIPTCRGFKPGDVDTMCVCVRRELAVRVKWADGGGRYSDYRWITKIAGLAASVNRCPLIIGEHL